MTSWEGSARVTQAWCGVGVQSGEPCPHVPVPRQAQELKHTIAFLKDSGTASN